MSMRAMEEPQAGLNRHLAVALAGSLVCEVLHTQAMPLAITRPQRKMIQDQA